MFSICELGLGRKRPGDLGTRLSRVPACARDRIVLTAERCLKTEGTETSRLLE